MNVIIILIIIGMIIIYPLFRIIQQMYGHPMNGYMEECKLPFTIIVSLIIITIISSLYYYYFIYNHYGTV